jgi:transcription initiation factor TFIIB
VRGRTISSVVATAIYIACRETGAPRTLKDIAICTNMKRKDLARTYRLLVLELDLKIPMVDPIKCLVKVANRANLNEKITRKAISNMEVVIESGVSAGKDPMGLAAAVLYLSCNFAGENMTQADIADAAGVTEVTVRNRHKELKDQINFK